MTQAPVLTDMRPKTKQLQKDDTKWSIIYQLRTYLGQLVGKITVTQLAYFLSF